MNKKIKSMVDKARNPETSHTRLSALLKRPEIEVRRALLDNPNLCPTDEQGQPNASLLEELAKEFLEEVANLPVFVLHALIEPNQWIVFVVMEVVERTKDVGLIEQLLSTWGPWWGVYRAIARNTHTPVNILRFLASNKEDQFWPVRKEVAQNKNTPEDLLCSMGDQKTEPIKVVRNAVAKNPTTPVSVLLILSDQATESAEEVLQSAKNALAKRGLA